MQRKKFFVLVVILMLVLPKNVFATTKTADEAINWVKSKVGGECLDIDGAYGCQCVDLILAYFDYLGVPHSYGNGGDYASSRMKSYVEGYGWQQIQGATPRKGDILVYTDGSYGHVGIYESDYSHYHQNVDGHSNVTRITYSYKGFNAPTVYWGVIRPNFNTGDTEAPVIEEAFVDPMSMTSNSFTVRAKVRDNVGVTKVQVASWTKANGQDDLRFDIATYNSSTGYYEYTVKTSEHNNEITTYTADIHAVDAMDNHAFVALSADIPMGVTPVATLGSSFNARIVTKIDKNYVIGVDGLTTSSNVSLKLKDMNSSSQIWHFKKLANGAYQITNYANPNLYLDVAGAGDADNTNVQLYTYTGSKAQNFYILNYDGAYMLHPEHSRGFRGVDVSTGVAGVDKNIQIFLPMVLDNDSQAWYLERTVSNVKLDHLVAMINDEIVDLESNTINVGEKWVVSRYVEPSNASNKTLKWTSSNSKVITVDSGGTITGISGGKATITATSTDGTNISGSIEVTVIQKDGIVEDNGKSYYYIDGVLQKGLINTDSGTYYANNNGILQTGLIEISGKKYYFNESYSMVKGKFITIDNKLYYFGAASGAMQKTGWYSRDGKTYYLDKKTGEVYVGLKTIDNITYYFNEKGVRQTGLVTVNNKSYYFDKDGKMVKGRFITIDGKLYYFGAASGTLQKTGWYSRDGKTYYLDKVTGEVYVGIKSINGSSYYFNSKGQLQTGLINTDSSTYYANNDGILQTGLIEISGKKYYFNESYSMVKGKFITIDNKLYYFGAASGAMQKTGWYEKNGKTYYLDKKTGEVYVGLKTIDNITYYFNEKGVRQTGLVTVNNKSYYFDKDGKMVKGRFITIDGKLYYFGAASGTLQKTGWYSRDGKTYYLDKVTGEVYVGLKTIDNITYYFNAKGVRQTGLVNTDSSTYYANNDGILQTGLVEISGKKYYFNESYLMVKGKFITIDNKLYYFGAASGAMQKTGWYEKNGKTYYLDKKTGEVYVGLKTIDNITYYFNAKGVRQTGLVTVNNKSYYFDKDGKMVKGRFITIDNKLYYFGAASGAMQKTGWYEKNGKTYYLDKKTGEVYIGTKIIEHYECVFDSKGVLQEKNLVNSTDEYKNLAISLVSENQNDALGVLNYTNDYRKEASSSNLVLDNDLSVAATIRAIEMAEYGYFEHKRSDGRDWYTIFGDLNISYTAVAENIAAGQSTPQKVCDSWKNSSGHYANMINNKYTKLGVGKYVYNGKTYWVQLFSK